MQTPEIISRKEAMARGLARYFTGKPCVNDHVAYRHTVGGNCSECIKEAKARCGENSEQAKAGKARRNKRWGDKNKERKAETGRRWRQQKPEAVRAHVLNRRALRRNATPPWFGELDELVMLEAADLATRREAATGIAWHVDHMIPLQARTVCGLHVATNVQVIPAAMNIAKGNKLQLTKPGEWVSRL